jgi:hypothetical protein
MKEKIAIIYLSRLGDVVNALPMAYYYHKQGHEVDFHVHPDFAAILEPVSYVKTVLWHGLHRDVNGCASWCMKNGGYNRVLDVQVNGNDNPPPFHTENFVAQAWARGGLLDKFHEIPLVFDKRDREGEIQATKHIPPDDPDNSRPLLVYSLYGHSSPMKGANQVESWIISEFSKTHRLLNIGQLPLRKPHHLLGILELASRLITIDTLPLHLSYATLTPTIALQPDQSNYGDGFKYYQSEPRKHWIEKLTYTECMSKDGRDRIVAAVRTENVEAGKFCRKLENIRKDKIIQVVDWEIPQGNNEAKTRMLSAHKTWEQARNSDQGYTLLILDTAKAPRTSRTTISDTRSLPYIRDIIEEGCKIAGDNDIVALTNSDICLVPEAIGVIRGKMMDQQCCFSRRVDVNNTEYRKTLRELSNMRVHPGADFFVFRKSWWEDNECQFPDMLLGCEGWDFVLRHIMLHTRSDAEIIPPIVYHQNHPQFWCNPSNITRNIGQMHNRRLCKEWAIAYGYEDALQESSQLGIFKLDGKFTINHPVEV